MFILACQTVSKVPMREVLLAHLWEEKKGRNIEGWMKK